LALVLTLIDAAAKATSVEGKLKTFRRTGNIPSDILSRRETKVLEY